MDNNLEKLEKCPCCGGKLYHKSLDKIVEGGYSKMCIICMSTIDNINFFEDGAKVIEPYLTKSYGGLYLGSDRGSSLMFLKEGYSNLENLIKIGNEYIRDGYSTLDKCYLYKFNPEINTGEFIWGKYNPFEEK